MTKEGSTIAVTDDGRLTVRSQSLAQSLRMEAREPVWGSMRMRLMLRLRTQKCVSESGSDQ